mmetsp:Transcript_11383/g.9791  ORF Transcript_11383/g.9791 Transcript_11383/m.9791 type:complete len:260 (+) Transcript_11383:388-1167(+)
MLKKHLKDKHNRYFCEICLEHRTLVFKEQKLFTSAQLERHLKKGDLDEEGNVVFFHPYCKFCDEYHYDEEALLKHLRHHHYQCDFCPPEYKQIWYKNYDTLEIHYNLSHYLCQDSVCRKSHTVFRTAAELEHHVAKVHRSDINVNSKQMKSINQNLIVSMANFNYGDSDQRKTKKEKVFLKDKEGVDFEPQLLSHKKFYTKFTTAHEVKADEALDIRRYFPENHITELYLDRQEREFELFGGAVEDNNATPGGDTQNEQ